MTDIIHMCFHLWLCTEFILRYNYAASVVKLVSFVIQPIVNTKSQRIFITPNNVHYLANFIDSSATIESRSIRFGRGRAIWDKLLQIPIAAAGELDAHTSIQVTVGLTPVNGDSDPSIGISDGVNVNRFHIVDTSILHVMYLLLKAQMRTTVSPLAEYHLSSPSSFLPSTSMGHALVPRMVATSMLRLSTNRLIQQMD